MLIAYAPASLLSCTPANCGMWSMRMASAGLTSGPLAASFFHPGLRWRRGTAATFTRHWDDANDGIRPMPVEAETQAQVYGWDPLYPVRCIEVTTMVPSGVMPSKAA